MVLNFDFGDEGKYTVELINGVLNHSKNVQAENAAATITMSRNVLNDMMLGETKLADASNAGDVKAEGDPAKLQELISYLDNFELLFNIVTPQELYVPQGV